MDDIIMKSDEEEAQRDQSNETMDLGSTEATVPRNGNVNGEEDPPRIAATEDGSGAVAAPAVIAPPIATGRTETNDTALSSTASTMVLEKDPVIDPAHEPPLATIPMSISQDMAALGAVANNTGANSNSIQAENMDVDGINGGDIEFKTSSTTTATAASIPAAVDHGAGAADAVASEQTALLDPSKVPEAESNQKNAAVVGSTTDDHKVEASTATATTTQAAVSIPVSQGAPIEVAASLSTVDHFSIPEPKHEQPVAEATTPAATLLNGDEKIEAAASAAQAADAMNATDLASPDAPSNSIDEPESTVVQVPVPPVIVMDADKLLRRPRLHRHKVVREYESTMELLPLSSADWYFDEVVPVATPTASTTTLATKSASKRKATESTEASADVSNGTVKPTSVFETTVVWPAPLLRSSQERLQQRLLYEATRNYLPRLLWYAVLEECQAAWYVMKSALLESESTSAGAGPAATSSTFGLDGANVSKKSAAAAAAANDEIDLDAVFVLPVSFTPSTLAQRIQQGCLLMGRQSSPKSSLSSPPSSARGVGRPRRGATTNETTTGATANTVASAATGGAAVSGSTAAAVSYLSAQFGGRVAMSLLKVDEWTPKAPTQSTTIKSENDEIDCKESFEEENVDKDDDDEYIVTDENDDPEDADAAVAESSDNVDETQLILNNPYLQPSIAEILSWIGQFGNKVFTTAVVQEAMVGRSGMVLGAEPTKAKKLQRTRASTESTGADVGQVLSESDTFVWSEMLLLRSKNNAATASLSSLVKRNRDGSDYIAVDEGTSSMPTAAAANFVFSASDNRDVRLVLQVAGEGLVPTSTLDEMMEWETAAFAKTQFTVRIINDSAWETLYNDVAEQAASRLHEQKTQRSWETYRSKGVQTGYCDWGRSSWIESVGTSNVMASVSSIAAAEAIAAPAAASDDPDFALAQALADPMDAADDAVGAGLGRRRKTRRAGESAGIYYGNQSNLTQKQLMDAMLRFVSLSSNSSSKKPFQSLVSLLVTIPDDSTDPMRRIRTALGRLVYKRNQLSRINVQTEWSDLPIWQALHQDPLWISPTAVEPADDGDKVEIVLSPKESADMKELMNYIRSLHQTELCLRQMVLKRLTEIPIALIACAADDRVGSMDATDDAYFEDSSTIEWQGTGHEFLARRIFRPFSRQDTDAFSTCYWFEVTSFAAAVPSEAPETAINPMEKPNIGKAKEPLGVKRRIRFLAKTVDPSATDQSPLILTEGQVKAGLKAAELNESRDKSSSSPPENPFASGDAQDISLFPPSDSLTPPITGSVVGHNRCMNQGNEIVHKILILPNQSSAREQAFWGTLTFPSTGAIECSIDGETELFTIQQFDYHPSSQAFQECLGIVKFLQRHPKGGVFQEPVDPIALKIPDYPLIVKNPMDVSTLLRKLERGEYSHIPPSHMKGYSPVARMLNGPFRRDVERIFDNATLFNPPHDWIHQAALVVKKAVIKKIEQVSATEFTSTGRQRKQNSMYAEYDSDVDMYVYESDADEEYGTSRKRAKRSIANTKSPAKEDAAARGIERGFNMQKLLSESFGLRGPLANLPIVSNASDFTLPEEWQCRHRAASDDVNASRQRQQKSIAELDELMCLHHLVQERDQVGLRRSTRAGDNPDGNSSGAKSSMLNQFEYVCNWDLQGTRKPVNRLEVEMARERLHETYFAKLFQSIGSKLDAADTNLEGWGRYSEGSFPPFLGRVVPMATDLASSDDRSLWEIREHAVVPALRWVLRGLIHTEHLAPFGMRESPNDLGVLVPNHVYYVDETQVPFDVVDVRDWARQKRAKEAPGQESEDEVELSEYEKERAARVARNAERLAALGLA